VNPIERFSLYLSNNAEDISKEIVDYNVKKLEIELPAEIIEQSVKTNRGFLTFLGETLNLSNEDVAEKFIEWHRQQQANQKDYQFNFEEISKILKPYAQTRLQLIQMLTKVTMREGLSTEEVVYVNNRISYLLDLSITESMIDRERLANEKNKINQKIITELSSPVVPLQNGMAILPLIGEFDFDRSDHIMNHVIPKISELKIKHLIIDFSGIATIDAEVASRIFNVNKVLRLIGIKTMLTGIRPDLAINVINAGIDFSKLNTYGTVQQAILSNPQ
jgi:rsbT co-antagonist protein RsbR